MAKKSSKKSSRAVSKKAAAKTSSKKSTPKAASTPKSAVMTQNNSQDWLPVVLIVLGVIVLIYAVFSLFSGAADIVEAAAVVNGVAITQDQVDTQYASLPEEYKQVYTKELILQQLIDEQLIYERAKNAGVSVSDEDIAREIQTILESGNLSLVSLEENLATFNLTIEDYEALIEKKIFVDEGIALILSEVQEPSQEEIQEFYDTNRSQFVQEPQVRVRHILISNQQENASTFASDVRAQLDTEDFCDLVEEYSEDQGSVNNCGEYTFGRGVMVSEFERASFDLSPGEVIIVQTTFGYHIIEKLADVPESVIALEEVEAQIRNALLNQKQVEAYQSFLEEAKRNSDIVIN